MVTHFGRRADVLLSRREILLTMPDRELDRVAAGGLGDGEATGQVLAVVVRVAGNSESGCW